MRRRGRERVEIRLKEAGPSDLRNGPVQIVGTQLQPVAPADGCMTSGRGGVGTQHQLGEADRAAGKADQAGIVGTRVAVVPDRQATSVAG